MIHNLTAQQNPAVTVIVPCRNEEEHIEECLRSILDQEPIAGGIEIIVADGMSTDKTRDILTHLSKENECIKVINNSGCLVSTGLNAAITAARGRIILRMDAHTIYARDYIRLCVEVLQQTGAENVGGPARTIADGYMQTAISAAYHSAFAVGGARFHDPDFEGYVDTVPYGCWPREIFDRIGLFDEQLVRNQDDEFNLRLIRAGGRIWQSPRIRSWYKPRGSLVYLFKQYMQYGYWKVRVIQKHRLPASVRHLIPGAFVLSLFVLPVISLWMPQAAWWWLWLVGLYFACSVTASVVAAWGKGPELFVLLPFVFACYHFGYGLGFVRGMWDFLILRRRPRPSLIELTRA